MYSNILNVFIFKFHLFQGVFWLFKAQTSYNISIFIILFYLYYLKNNKFALKFENSIKYFLNVNQKNK